MRWSDGRNQPRGGRAVHWTVHTYLVVCRLVVSETSIDCSNDFRASGWTLSIVETQGARHGFFRSSIAPRVQSLRSLYRRRHQQQPGAATWQQRIPLPNTGPAVGSSGAARLCGSLLEPSDLQLDEPCTFTHSFGVGHPWHQGQPKHHFASPTPTCWRLVIVATACLLNLDGAAGLCICQHGRAVACNPRLWRCC